MEESLESFFEIVNSRKIQTLKITDENVSPPISSIIMNTVGLENLKNDSSDTLFDDICDFATPSVTINENSKNIKDKITPLLSSNITDEVEIWSDPKFDKPGKVIKSTEFNEIDKFSKVEFINMDIS